MLGLGHSADRSAIMYPVMGNPEVPSRDDYDGQDALYEPLTPSPTPYPQPTPYPSPTPYPQPTPYPSPTPYPQPTPYPTCQRFPFAAMLGPIPRIATVTGLPWTINPAIPTFCSVPTATRLEMFAILPPTAPGGPYMACIPAMSSAVGYPT